MDFNYFYHRQQVSLMRAQAAASSPARAAHQALASLYLASISRSRAERGAGPATLPAGAVLR